MEKKGAPANPFKGPTPYEEGDKFYGREEEIVNLYNIIRNEPLTLLFARSGTGKTSLIKAGLIPKLRNEFNFLPVYIHLDSQGVKESSALDLCDYVIKLCELELKRYVHDFGANLVEIVRQQQTAERSLFEYIHSLKIVLSDNSMEADAATHGKDGNDIKPAIYVIRPLLIFDQFEEILTQPFIKDDLRFILNELRCLLENQIPDYLNNSFNGSADERYMRLKGILLRKQKDFRIIFSFREEYLPQFESLRKEIPSIRYTNSRYRLESFSVPIAIKVIVSTASNIPLLNAQAVTAELAVNVSSNFDKVIVEPFLLSLVCYKLYTKLCNNPDKSDSSTGTAEIKNLVNEAIENYVNEIYSKISDAAKAFIEEKLVTSDHKRTTYSYNDASRDPALKDDLDNLVKLPEYRLLNREQFLDSIHIEILHDRLLPPIAKRREMRLKKIEDDALLEKQRQLDDELNDYKNNRIRRILYFATLGLSLLLSLIFLYLISVKSQNNIKLAGNLSASLNTSNRQRIMLKNYADSLKKKNDALSSSRYTTDSLTKQLQKQNDKLTQQNTELTQTKSQLQIALHSADSVNDISQSLVDTLKVEKSILENEKNNKDKLAGFFKKQFESLVGGLQKTDPFQAMALAAADYLRMRNAGVRDITILKELEGRLLNIYRNGALFTSVTLGTDLSYRLSGSNGLLAAHKESSSENAVFFYPLDGPRDQWSLLSGGDSVKKKALLPDSIKFASESGFARNLRVYDFSENGKYFYLIKQTELKDTLLVWAVKGGRVQPNPLFVYAMSDQERKVLQYGQVPFLKQDQIICCWNDRKKINIWVFDFKTGKPRNYSLQPGSPDERVYSISLNAAVILVYRPSMNFWIYRLKKSASDSYTETPLPANVDYMTTRGDSTLSLRSGTIHSAVLIQDATGELIDSIPFPGKVGRRYLFSGNKLITMNEGYDKILVIQKDAGGWHETDSFLLSSQPFWSSNGSAGILSTLLVSPDGSLLACIYNSSYVVIFDLKGHRQLAYATLPDELSSRLPVFSQDKTHLFLFSTTKMYSLYFAKRQDISTAEGLISLLDSGYYRNAWPIPEEDMVRLGLK
jgi:hypothetical protein